MEAGVTYGTTRYAKIMEINCKKEITHPTISITTFSDVLYQFAFCRFNIHFEVGEATLSCHHIHFLCSRYWGPISGVLIVNLSCGPKR